MKNLLFLIITSLFFINGSQAQKYFTDSNLSISGYLETYFVFDFSNPNDHLRPQFLYSFNRHNEVNLNMGYVMAAYDNSKVRGKLALMTGTYANANLSAEPGVLKNIFEANAGVKISTEKELWIDAGVFASHIGFESAVGANCWNMTRSLLAENSPYYLSGVKVSYTSENRKWFLSGLLLNGWQRIQRIPGNNTPAAGHQLTWTPNEKVTLNSSSFAGSDSPDSTRKMRYFHNLYGQFQLSNKFALLAGLDMGAEQKAYLSNRYNFWYSPVLIARLSSGENLAFAGRLEYYSDKNGVIISTGQDDPFQVFGYSLNMDLRVTDNLLWRLEGRVLNSKKERIFLTEDGASTRENLALGTSLSISF